MAARSPEAHFSGDLTLSYGVCAGATSMLSHRELLGPGGPCN